MATPEEILKEARKLIGAETKPVKAKYPIEYEMIRRFCHLADNNNPLFLDPEYAKKEEYGEVICPPGAVNLITRGSWPPSVGEEERLPAIPTPGTVPFNMGTEWEFFRPIKVGERLSYKQRISDVYIKGMRYDPQTFWTTTEQVYLDEAGKEVCIMRRLGVNFRSAEELKRDGVTGYPR